MMCPAVRSGIRCKCLQPIRAPEEPEPTDGSAHILTQHPTPAQALVTTEACAAGDPFALAWNWQPVRIISDTTSGVRGLQVRN